jgi:nicotinate dehydrogenase subunit B
MSIMKRRDFLRTSSVIVVSFAFGGVFPESGTTQTPALGKPLDPREVDSFLAIHRDGSVTIYTSKVDVGTGLSMAMSQMVAEELGISVDRITVVEGDTGPHAGPGLHRRQHGNHSRRRGIAPGRGNRPPGAFEAWRERKHD